MDADRPPRDWYSDARERWRWAEFDRRARSAWRRLDDAAARASRDIEQSARDAERSAPAGQLPGRARDLEDQLLVWAVPVAGLAAVPLVVGHVAAVLVHGSWPSYDLADVPGILGRVVTNLGDPGRAWDPVNTGAAVPGPVAWWGTFLLLALIGGLLTLLVWAARHPGGSGAGTAGVATRWAGRTDQRPLWVRKGDPHHLVAGASDGHRLAVRDRHSLLVVGPAHTGKTSGVTIPAVVEWDGPAVVVSTKGHLIDQTIGWRSRQGDVHVYDPAAVTRYYRSGWSLLAECVTWEGAISAASDLTLAARATVGASRAGDGITSEERGDIWRSSMAMSLAPFLFAAVSSGRSIGAAAEWIEREERDEVLDVLDTVDRTAARAHRSTFMRPDPSRSMFLHAMHEILSVYEDPVVAASMDRHEIVPAEILDGANTLYLTTPEHDQARFRPLCAMIVRRMLAAAYDQSARSGRPLDPPLLVVLDDALGIAPVYDLAALASTAAPRGVQIVSVVQDLAQLDEQYGDAADLVIKNHAARLVLPSGTNAGSTTSERLLAPALMRELRTGEAALLYGTRSPVRVELRHWFRDAELKRRVETPQDALRPAERTDSSVPLSVAEQSALWLKRMTDDTVDEPTDPTIPLDTRDRRYVEVFGSIDDDKAPAGNVTSLFDRSRHRRRTGGDR